MVTLKLDIFSGFAMLPMQIHPRIRSLTSPSRFAGSFFAQLSR